MITTYYCNCIILVQPDNQEDSEYSRIESWIDSSVTSDANEAVDSEAFLDRYGSDIYAVLV